MRHRVAHRKLGRTTPHRRALLRNLATALFDKERIRTTLHKAKELRPFAEQLITLAKREENRLHARRLAARDLQDPAVVQKLFDTIGPRFATRPGGYTRILRLGPRKGDGAEMAYLELVGYEYKPAGKDGKAPKQAAARRRPTRRKPSPRASRRRPRPRSPPRRSLPRRRRPAQRPTRARAVGEARKGRPSGAAPFFVRRTVALGLRRWRVAGSARCRRGRRGRELRGRCRRRGLGPDDGGSLVP